MAYPPPLYGTGSAGQRSERRADAGAEARGAAQRGAGCDAGPVLGTRREPLFMHNGVRGGRGGERAAGFALP